MSDQPDPPAARANTSPQLRRPPSPKVTLDTHGLSQSGPLADPDTETPSSTASKRGRTAAAAPTVGTKITSPTARLGHSLDFGGLRSGPEPSEQYLERQNVAAILEGFVGAVLANRPESIAQFGADFFASAAAITAAGPHRLSNNPLVPHAPADPPSNASTAGSARGPLALSHARARSTSPGGMLGGSADVSLHVSSNASPKNAGAPRNILAPAGQSPQDVSLEPSHHGSRRESATTTTNHAGSPATGGGLSSRSESAADHPGSHLPAISDTLPTTGSRPNKRHLKRLFAAPPSDPPIVFDLNVPPRQGHYGIVRKAKWGEHGTVAVKQVPVEATWTLDELRHLRQCQTTHSLHNSISHPGPVAARQGSITGANASSSLVMPLGPPAAPVAGGGSPASLGLQPQQTHRGTPLTSSQRHHWDVVKCLAVFYEPEGDKLWYVFEWIDETLDAAATAVRTSLGITALASHVARGPEVRWQLEHWTAFVIRQLVLALQHVHNVGGRVHIDVKPANVLIRRRQTKSVTVFAPTESSPPDATPPDATMGTAGPDPPLGEEPASPSSPPSGVPSRVRRIRDEVAATRSPAGGLRSRSPGTTTTQGTVPTDFDVVLADFGTAQEIGTPLQQLGDFKYIPPEVYDAADVAAEDGGIPALELVNAGVATSVPEDNMFRPSCDVWSVGCITIHCLEGYAPFDLDEKAVFTALRSCWLQPTTQHPRLWSPELTSFLSLCFERDSRLRPNAEELLDHPWLRTVA